MPPIEMERNLKQEAEKKFNSTTSPRARAYIYGPIGRYKKGLPPKKPKRK